MVLALVLAAIARISCAISGSLDQIAGRLVAGSAGRYPGGVKLSGRVSGISVAGFFFAIIFELLVTKCRGFLPKPFHVYAVLLEKFDQQGGMLAHVIMVYHIWVHFRSAWRVVYADKD